MFSYVFFPTRSSDVLPTPAGGLRWGGDVGGYRDNVASMPSILPCSFQLGLSENAVYSQMSKTFLGNMMIDQWISEFRGTLIEDKPKSLFLKKNEFPETILRCRCAVHPLDENPMDWFSENLHRFSHGFSLENHPIVHYTALASEE